MPKCFEFLFPVRRVIFSPSSGFFSPVRESRAFHDLIDKDGKFMKSPIAPTKLVVTDDHVGKTVMSPGSGAWIKGRDTLLAWLKESVDQIDSV